MIEKCTAGKFLRRWEWWKVSKNVILKIENLKTWFPVTGGFPKKVVGYVKAVDGVSFEVYEGETLGIVGESGCGKTTLGRTIVRLYKPTDGKIWFKNEELTHLSDKELLPYRRKIQMVFQDPYASLNPRMTVAEIIGEALDIHKLYKTKDERQERIYQLLETVGLVREHANRFPHEFSGGQRQRIGIARALAVQPELIVLDEPISALDVSIQAQVVNVLIDLQEKYGLTYLFIAHDLSMVRYISDRVIVMYLGNVVEEAPSRELFRKPLHPYTEALLSAVPIPDPKIARQRKRIILQGEVPSPLNPPPGCPFSTRCPYAKDICFKEKPQLKEVGGRKVACHFPLE